jgi:hypothetical protein
MEIGSQSISSRDLIVFITLFQELLFWRAMKAVVFIFKVPEESPPEDSLDWTDKLHPRFPV